MKKKFSTKLALIIVGSVTTLLFGAASLTSAIIKSKKSSYNISEVNKSVTAAGFTGEYLYYGDIGSTSLNVLFDGRVEQQQLEYEITGIYSNHDYVGVSLQNKELIVYKENEKALDFIAPNAVNDFAINGNKLLACSKINATRNYIFAYDYSSTFDETSYSYVALETNPIGIDVSNDGDCYYANYSGDIYRLDQSGSKLNATLEFSHPQTISSFCLDGDNRFVVGSENGLLSIYNQEFKEEYSLKTGSSPIQVVANADKIATLTNDGKLYLIKGNGNFRISSVSQAKAITISNSGTIFISKAGNNFVIDFANGVKVAVCSIIFPIAIGFLVVSVVFLIVVIVLSLHQTSADKAKDTLKKVIKNWKCYAMLAPMFAFLIVFIYIPVVWGFSLAFRVYENGVPVDWTLFDNFKAVFQDQYFWSGVKNMIIFLVTDLLKALIVPLIVAELIVALWSKKFQYASKVMMYIVGVIPGVAGMLIWRYGIYGSEGLLNQFFAAIGVESLAKHDFLGSPDTALGSIIMIGFPWVGSYLIIYGGLTSIPRSYYEAARLEGYTGIRKIFAIDIPMLMPQFKFLFVVAFISSIQEFNRVYLTTEGGPGGSTYTPSLELFYYINKFHDPGVAGAMGVLLFAAIFGASFFFFRSRSREGATV